MFYLLFRFDQPLICLSLHAFTQKDVWLLKAEKIYGEYFIYLYYFKEAETNYISCTEAFNSVVNTKHSVTSIQAVPNETPDGRVHPASRRPDVHHGQA